MKKLTSYERKLLRMAANSKLLWVPVPHSNAAIEAVKRLNHIGLVDVDVNFPKMRFMFSICVDGRAIIAKQKIGWVIKQKKSRKSKVCYKVEKVKYAIIKDHCFGSKGEGICIYKDRGPGFENGIKWGGSIGLQIYKVFLKESEAKIQLSKLIEVKQRKIRSEKLREIKELNKQIDILKKELS